MNGFEQLHEYILSWTDAGQWQKSEEIVRCRDCIYRRNRWNGKRPTFSDWFFCAYWGGNELTNLDGFCAWGERRGDVK